MRIARVTGTVTINQRDEHLPDGKYLICEVLDRFALAGLNENAPRKTPIDSCLVAYDEIGAGEGCLIAVAESAEASAPFRPNKAPIDAYCAAILNEVEFELID